MPVAVGQMVVHEADALHEAVDDRRADESEASTTQVGRQCVGFRRGCRHVRPARSVCQRRGGARKPGRQIGRERAAFGSEAQGPARRCRSWRRPWLDCGRFRGPPGGAHGRDLRIRLRPAARSRRRLGGRPRACAGSSPRRVRPGSLPAQGARTARGRPRRARPTPDRDTRP